MVIGGAEDKLRDRVILGRFVSLAGGPGAHIVVVTTASSLGEEATNLYREIFLQAGVGRVSGLRPLTREEADDSAAAALIDEATGIFLTGGNQLKLSLVVGGTALGDALLRANRRGVVVAGTSAGASAVSTHMVAFGASGATPKHRMVQISAGLGLLEGIVVDQHFEQRTRLGRLLAVVAQSPSLLGVGLDEDTAAIVDADQILDEQGPPRGTLSHYPNKGDQVPIIAGAPAPPLIAAQIWAQAIQAQMIVRYFKGEAMEKTLDWAASEVEGLKRT